ncbi:MAG TPA: chemotaxis protein CheB [Candidatus Cloacimonadota bacterium]|nr:chemotaxis protein CheB [Candidatus Cloacimonadota bacterium]
MIRVLIVEDSKVVCNFLKYLFEQDGEMEVAGICHNGADAIRLVDKLKPDVVTMDVDMPIMSGIEATQKIMATNPVPIVIVTTSRNARERDLSMEALAAGALKVLNKPHAITNQAKQDSATELVRMVKLLSEVKVITRKAQSKQFKEDISSQTNYQFPSIEEVMDKDIIVIGISSGGPPVLQEIFSDITPAFPLPIVVAQHITKGFLQGLVNWLNNLNVIQAQVARKNEIFVKGKIYFAPDDANLRIVAKNHFDVVAPEKDQICSSVAELFRSTGKVYGNKTIAMILTGMGKDGALETKHLFDLGALTIAQDKESALIHGMPGVAINLGGAKYIMNTQDIKSLLEAIEKRRVSYI